MTDENTEGHGATAADLIGDDDKLASAAERIRRIAGVQDPDDAERARRRLIYEAQRTASHCAQCGCQLKPMVPVWRRRLGLGYGFGGWRSTVAPVCKRCASSSCREFAAPQPCEHCARPVHQKWDRVWRRRTFCCESCAKAAVATAARQARSDVRGTRQCDSCGETFDPTRTDARYCSNACRQRAHRRRTAVTADECLDGATFVSRNAVTAPERPASHTFASRNADRPVTADQAAARCAFNSRNASDDEAAA
jgi:hypothetical protein